MRLTAFEPPPPTPMTLITAFVELTFACLMMRVKWGVLVRESLGSPEK